jgi:thiamine-phosphate pyrophosphorylase
VSSGVQRRDTALRGLYAITDERLSPPGRLLSDVEAALRGGARLIQHRAKSRVPSHEEEARALLALCHRYGVPLIINDDVALARRIGADGVHLGREDGSLAEARAALGAEAIVGISCYNQLERALEASAAGASYVAFGRFFPSRTKPEAEPAEPALLRKARARISLPLVAIGGITPENAHLLLAAGADVLAVIHGVFGQPDPEVAAQRYAALFGAP